MFEEFTLSRNVDLFNGTNSIELHAWGKRLVSGKTRDERYTKKKISFLEIVSWSGVEEVDFYNTNWWWDWIEKQTFIIIWCHVTVYIIVTPLPLTFHNNKFLILTNQKIFVNFVFFSLKILQNKHFVPLLPCFLCTEDWPQSKSLIHFKTK